MLDHLLTWLIFLPLIYGLIAWFSPENLVRPISLALSSIHFLLSLLILTQYDPSTPALQLADKMSWVPQFGINYHVAVDGISLWLVILSTFLVPVMVLGSWTAIQTKTRAFHMSLFFLQTTMVGTFLAIDSILFYIFFEASLIPMYFMVGIWGGARRIYATLKFFIYTMVGSVFMLLAIIFLIYQCKEQLGFMSASILDFYKLELPFVAGTIFSTQTALMVGFALAFGIKVPMFPVHTWLPDAHVEAPTPGSVILAGVMLKMGTYGFLRFVLPMFPDAVSYWGWLFLFLGAVGIVYGALVAMVQPDIKKLVAYSSVSHMGYVIIGLFALNEYGITGGLYQMLNHGISTGALFFLVGMIYERTHSREIAQYGGLAPVAPIFTILFIIVTMSSIAVPMTNGFVGEFLILMGTYLTSPAFAIIAVTGVVLGAAYMLWMVKRVFFGAEGEIVTKYKASGLDVNRREIAVMTPMVILIFWMGLFPNHFLKYSKVSIAHLVETKTSYQLSVMDNPGRSMESVAQVEE